MLRLYCPLESITHLYSFLSKSTTVQAYSASCVPLLVRSKMSDTLESQDEDHLFAVHKFPNLLWL